MFVTPAYAQTQPTGGLAGGLTTFLPFILIFVIMYFLIIRPQQRKAKAHREMVASVRRGDTVITAGGFVAKVSKVVDDAELEIELAKDTKVRVLRHTIQEVRSKSEPANDNK